MSAIICTSEGIIHIDDQDAQKLGNPKGLTLEVDGRIILDYQADRQLIKFDIAPRDLANIERIVTESLSLGTFFTLELPDGAVHHYDNIQRMERIEQTGTPFFRADMFHKHYRRP